MNNDLKIELNKLKLRENELKKCLEYKYYDIKKRTSYFEELKLIKKEINKLNFKLNLEREIKNAKSR